MRTLKLLSVPSNYILSIKEYEYLWRIIFKQLSLQCKRYGVTIKEFYGNYKDKNTVAARMSVLKWIRENLVFEISDRIARLGYYNSNMKQYKLPYVLIGHMFHKDHTTIIDMEKRIKKNEKDK